MSQRLRAPRCQGLVDEDRPCGHDMSPLAERDPSFGPNYRPGVWVFRCNYCGAIRAIEREKVSL